MKHWVFYDARCPFCERQVQRLQRWDTHHRLAFFALSDPKIEAFHIKDKEALILVERGERIWRGGRAVLRICWLLGGWRKAIGILAFFPCGVDALYNFIAKHRHQL